MIKTRHWLKTLSEATLMFFYLLGKKRLSNSRTHSVTESKMFVWVNLTLLDLRIEKCKHAEIQSSLVSLPSCVALEHTIHCFSFYLCCFSCLDYVKQIYRLVFRTGAFYGDKIVLTVERRVSTFLQ